MFIAYRIFLIVMYLITEWWLKGCNYPLLFSIIELDPLH